MTVINYSLDAISKAVTELQPLDYRTIHVAGTNGKGSTCTFLELLYLNCLPELKIGKYISPHIWNLTERFSISGRDISQDELDAQRLMLESLGLMDGLTDFEQETLIALEYFRQNKIDVAILEVGLGGRLDATNVIAAEKRLATAITNISFDHMEYLGDTLEKIRYEKEGIKREGVSHFESTVIASESKQSPNSKTGANFLLALEIFESINNLKVSEEIKEQVLKQFPLRYKGRFNYSNGVLVDGAHNPDGMRILNSFIQSLNCNFDRKIFVLAFLDKDYQSCLQELFANNVLDIDKDIVILTEIDSERATPAAFVEEYIEANCLIIQDPVEAIAKAKELKTKDDLVIITGSLRLVAFAV